MKHKPGIITVGLSPTWDIICKAENIEWDTHRVLAGQTVMPAGKALNISRALHWMGTASAAAGLWGEKDYPEMLDQLKSLGKRIDIRFTKVPGRTRQNITVIDTIKNREIHLRAKSELATRTRLTKLRLDLPKLISPGDFCVFAGSMPGHKVCKQVLTLLTNCRKAQARVVMDASGPIVPFLVQQSDIFLLKPNVEELGELIGRKIPDQTHHLIRVAQKLLDQVKMVLISRGEKGVVFVSANLAYEAICTNPPQKVLTTVGCGDYLLAGFLKGFRDNREIETALRFAVQAASAKAAGLTGEISWTQAQRIFKVKINKL